MTDSFFTSIYILAQDGRKDISSRDPAGESKFLARTLNIKYGGVLESLPLYDNKSKAVAAFFSFLASVSVMRSFLIGRLVRGIVPQSSCLRLQEEIGENSAAGSPNGRRTGG